ncbi:DUF547 domain-containing protein [Marinobacter sp.]|uniref:DUF547 domain-containing protein n=1 Tax=Marinobacter sp. TaxID=50741 RepID=UPI0019E3DB1F|nr:DUF547 domain-containing protein [Marinobacter sp.]MBE0486958.1 DUF547 domain-containing protein [Marinobacter sp.]
MTFNWPPITAFFSRALIALWFLAGSALAETSPYEPFQQLVADHLIEHTLPGNGLVSAFDYQSALADDQTQPRLEQQRARLASFDLSQLDSREHAVAFWINAYNFFMIDQILTERPNGQLVSSVWDYGGRINPFVKNVFGRANFIVGGQAYSLDEIEKGILLGDDYQARGWKDARVHFAVNCASVGCPPLRTEIYTAANLEKLLAENTRRALSTERQLRVESGRLYVSELFKWYEKDFQEASGSNRAFILEWATPEVSERVKGAAGLSYIDYDWSLNTPANFPEMSR